MTVSRSFGFFLAIVFVVIVASYGVTTFVVDKQNQTANTTNDILYKNSLQACERGNKLRLEGNLRAGSHEKQDEAIRLIGETARDARRSDFKAEGKLKDKVLADRYQKALDYLAGIKFDRDPLVTCRDIIKKPLRIDQ